MVADHHFSLLKVLKPRTMHWLHIAVVRPMSTSGCLIWHSMQKQIIMKLAKIQRLACLCSPTAAMEIMLNPLPLDSYIKVQAGMGEYKLKCIEN